MPANTDKEVTFTFRVEPGLKDAFVQAARSNDRSASLLIRDFMREYVEREKAAALRNTRKT
jgi:predicted transcriptional regulator